ncbi:MAG: glycoside hydrolase family 2 TIM barrel-domain containing protein [Bacteroidota bacterium]|nr:glycoside hydrolase family 2 TIM barrel-domain containing protein [Bacteroidota bacterium]
MSRRTFALSYLIAPLPWPLLIAAVLLASTVSAQPRFFEQRRALPKDLSLGLLAPSEYKSIIDLNGSWRYRADDDATWRSVQVPSSYRGIHNVVFRRGFTVPRALLGSSVFQLSAQSVSYYCEISINGQFIGKHAGLTPFSFKISPGILRAGSNTIEMHVHNKLSTHETVPLYEQLWERMNYGGIVHDIGIVAHRGVWAQETYVSTEIAGEGRPATLHYRVLLNSGEISRLPGDTASLAAGFGKSVVLHSFDVIDPLNGMVVASSEASRVVVESDRLREVEMTVTVPSVRLWSPDAPNIYMLRQRTTRGGVVLDESMQQIGFRDIRLSGNGLTVNGASVFVKALTYVEDSPRHGRSLSLDEMERDVLLMKNLGVNSLRLVYGSVHPYFISLCDRYGIMLFVDLPLRNVPDALLSKDGIRVSARNTCREISSRDQMHPSLVAIGVAQGLQTGGPLLASYIKEVRSVFREREMPVLYASFQSILPRSLPEGLDMIGMDVSPESTQRVTELLRRHAETERAYPVFISSLMYPVQIGNYHGYSDTRSIDAQGQFFLQMFKESRDLGYAGIVVHSFSDWAVSRPIMAVDRVHEYTATTGVVDRYRQKRIAYDVLKASFNNEKAPVLVTGNYEEDHPVSFVVIGILIILVFAVVYNLFRRFRENVSRSLLRPYNFFADVRDQRMLSIFQTSMVGVIGALSAALLLANFLYFWRMNILVDHVIAQFVHHGWLKQWLNYAAWNPLANTLLTALLLFVVLLIVALLIWFAAFVTRKKVFLFDAYSVSMWSVLPMITLAPLGMVLYRVMDVPVLDVVAVLVYVIFHIWIISRVLKGIAIVFDIRPVFFYIGGYVLLGAGLAWWLVSLNGEYSIFAYLKYFAAIWWSTGSATIS